MWPSVLEAKNERQLVDQSGRGIRFAAQSARRNLTVADVAMIRVQCVNRTDARQEPCDDAQILFLLGDGL